MNQGERRIRKLRLVSSDSTLLRAAPYQLAEAFRLASLPGLPPNALVLIRRLDLGEIRTDLPPWQLASRIENLVRELGTRAVCVDRQAAAAAPVVWFSDPLQPHVALMTRLLDNRPAVEWYWHSLFGRQPPLTDSAGIETLLADAAATPLKALGQSLLLQHCLAPARRRDRLFSLLTRPMAIRLLAGLGLSLAGRGAQGRAPETPRLAGTMAHDAPPAVPAGPDTASRPAPASPSATATISAPNASLAWRAALQWAARLWGDRDERTVWLAYHALLCHQPAYLTRSDTLQRIVPADWLAHWSSAGLPGNKSPGSAPVAGTHAAAAEKPVAVPPPGEMAGSRAPRTAGQPREPVVTTDPGDGVMAEQGKGADPAAPMQPPAPKPCRAAARQESCGTFSSHAGFALLIPLLARLGMADLLARHEMLTALDFPGRLLAAFARRCGLGEDDPCWPLVAHPGPADNPVLELFRAPAAWWRLATAGNLPLRRFQLPASGGCAITAPGGRWLLAVDDGFAARGDDELRGYAVQDSGALPQPVRFEELLRAMQLAAALFLRRNCAMSWRTLLARPGRVVLTPTHWDVIFALDRTDLRLRRMALDNDPGWVVWLGKVVQFHYN